jgi:hypothetical protein
MLCIPTCLLSLYTTYLVPFQGKLGRPMSGRQGELGFSYYQHLKITHARFRLSLSVKGLQYKTVWVEFPEIESVCKKIGAKPTSTKHLTTPCQSYTTHPQIQSSPTPSKSPVISMRLTLRQPHYSLRVRLHYKRPSSRRSGVLS